LFRQDIKRFEAGLEKLLKVDITQYQYDALLSFVYNLGFSSDVKKYVINKINTQKIDEALDSWALFYNAG
jgi:lysozyme